jgi:hypothetical protein
MRLTRSVPSLLSATAIILAIILISQAIVAQPERTSANYFMPGCRDVASLINFSISEQSKEDSYRMGVCSGIMVGLGYLGKSYGMCLPAEATSQQAAVVVVQYIDGRPERMGENFMALSVEALKAAWPCTR